MSTMQERMDRARREALGGPIVRVYIGDGPYTTYREQLSEVEQRDLDAMVESGILVVQERVSP